MVCHHLRPMSGLNLWPWSPQGLAKRGGIATKHNMLLLSLPWEYTHPTASATKCSGQFPDTWSLSLPKTLQLGAAGAAPPSWAKWDRVLLAWSAGGRGKPPQLSLIPEVGMAHCHWRYLNKNHLQPHSLKGTTEEGIVTEHHLSVLSNLWEHTCPAAATAKYSRQSPHT